MILPMFFGVNPAESKLILTGRPDKRCQRSLSITPLCYLSYLYPLSSLPSPFLFCSLFIHVTGGVGYMWMTWAKGM